jgi:hypothetical protein
VAVPAALLCEGAHFAFIGGPLLAAAHTPGYLPRQQFSVSIADYAAVRQGINTAMMKAGMSAGHRFHRLLVDDVTYLALQQDPLPIHQLGVLNGFVWAGSIDNPVRYLVSRQSEGVVISCANLPPDMEMAASRSGAICALSRSMLVHLAAATRANGRTPPRCAVRPAAIGQNITAPGQAGNVMKPYPAGGPFALNSML